jgi:GNAT superfamily N-acetyltransferase
MRMDGEQASTTVGDRNSELAERLGIELKTFNASATGVDDQRGLSVQVRDAAQNLVAGLSGWTWGSCAGLELVWVRDDLRGSGYGSRLLEAAEAEVCRRGCARIFVSSYTFQAPGFYMRRGYVVIGRTEGIPTGASAEVHLAKALPLFHDGRPAPSRPS